MASNYRTIQSSFVGGVISPMNEGAVGGQGYAQSLSIAENVLYGSGYGISKRQGTKMIGLPERPVVRVVPLIHNNRSCFLAIMSAAGQQSVQFYADIPRQEQFTPQILADPGRASLALNTSANSSANSISCPWNYDDIQSLDIKIMDDDIFIVHQNYKPSKITIIYNAEDNIYRLSELTEISFVAPVQTDTQKTTAYTFAEPGDWPSRQFFYQGRWFLFGTKNNPSGVYYSRSYDIDAGAYRYTDFTYSRQDKVDGVWKYIDLADFGGLYVNSTMDDARIRWVTVHQGALMVATGRAIYTDEGAVATASTEYPFSLKKIIDYGAAENLVVSVGVYLIFVGADNRTLKCMAWSQNYNGYSGATISSPISQYIKNDIAELCVTDTGPQPIIWVRTTDYDLLYCYFEQAQIIAWARFTFSGQSYASCIAAVQGGEDGVCTLVTFVRRTRSEQQYDCLESFDILPPDTAWKYPQVDAPITLYNDPESFPDGYFTIPGHSIDPVTGQPLSRSMIEAIYPSADHSDFSIEPVSLGNSDRLYFGRESFLCLGYPYDMCIGTLRQEIPANGTSQGCRRKLDQITLRLYNSIGGRIALRPKSFDKVKMIDYSMKVAEKVPDDEFISIINVRYGSGIYGKPSEMFTGDIKLQFNSKVIDDDRIIITSSTACPFVLTAIIEDFIYMEA